MTINLDYQTRWQHQIALLDETERALREVGHPVVKRKRGKHIITPTAVLTPVWTCNLAGDPCLILSVRGKLDPHHLGALHLRGLL